ncbi:integrase [Microbacterium endophyticum]|uniref:Integrase n=1 Tax=Microbacterium endophyticum TaxID=1526412 RepID=A0A7W4YKL3_9MICO|nr:site-specific integrase [Microbacterium endophyticum]MBB2974485.1 integrase [Microbacterium endophyticum]NIK36782.1 integrase [Microbacterium endophyticum]
MTISRVTRSDGTVRFRVRVKSGRNVVASRTFDKKGDAQLWESAQKRSLYLGEFVDPKAGRELIGAAMDRWHVGREGTIGNKTYSDTERPALRHVKALRSRPVGAVTARDFETLYATLLRSLSRDTVVRYRQVYSAFFSWAVASKLVNKNVVIDSQIPKGTSTKAKREIFPFNVAELRAVHTEMLSYSNKTNADIVLVLGLSGLRWGELAALRVRDVQQLPYPALRVSRSQSDGQEVRNVTKGGKTRTVPLTDEVASIILPLIRHKQPDDLVYPNTVGKPRTNRNWTRDSHWGDVHRGRRVHDLRHTAATIWLQSGVDLKTVQAWLGHSSATLTADLYAHYMGSDADTAALARMNRVLGDAGGTPIKKLQRSRTAVN